ncbi:hypothetical protein D9611_005969 [Ephemerocybe angulata]|uniref:RecQ-mediated genome instability protein 1 n=1 Tax=Ephemerocybe angulata TaxID=980116 RepID=A0A8H5FLQ3_9AGAR|nr:hypothetical protein D9611_005969 [Tulosesus angulatus]
MEPITEHIRTYIRDTFPSPMLKMEWLVATLQEIKSSLEYLIQDDELSEDHITLTELRSRILNSPFADTMVPGTGLPRRITHPMTHTKLEGPIVLDLLHMDEIGVSAFRLERVRMDRDEACFLNMLRLASFCPGITEEMILRASTQLPEYPRKRLKIYLSDGTIELIAMEYMPLPLKLGITPMGTKLVLEKVPIIGGVAFLDSDNTKVMGGCTPELEDEHLKRLRKDWHLRMKEELQALTEAENNPQNLLS